MAQGRKGDLNYRCPRCLMREIDMDMRYDQMRMSITAYATPSSRMSGGFSV